MACSPTELAAAALASIDDEFALIDDQPVAVAGIWREVFSSMLDGHASAVLIHPSWWSDLRIASVSHSARSVVPKVALARRSEMLASAVARRPSVVVEIAESFVTLSRPSDERPVRAVSRAAGSPVVADEVVDEVASLTGGRGGVVMDRADGVGGAAELGELITHRLGARGFTVAVIGDDRLLDASDVDDSAGDDERRTPGDVVPVLRPRRTRLRSLVGGVAAAGVLTGVVMVAGDPTPARSPTTLLVEGRVVAEVPATWPARRITAGPGSVRVQVTSPTDPQTALHVTQSPVPTGETLARTADTLRRALLAEPPGVFVDFNPDDRRGGRPAVTYREIRDGHDILWTVLLDGTVRIGIGCQSARGSQEAVRTECERAIASARNIGELAGTVAPQSQSNTT
jgi:type VII secretion-associated protein (TIGR03931 family)